MKKVFISSPYTLGDISANVRKQMDSFNELMDLGFAPFCPLLFHFQHIVHPRQYQDWLQIDLEYLSACDYLLRLPGESAGADREVEFAKEKGIPVFYSVEQLHVYTLNLWS